jgi:predicted acylesterase/phospholipase RssA
LLDSEPVPVEVVRKMGADIVIAVNLDNATLDSNSVNIPTLSSVPMRSINILRHHLALESTKTADVVIVPSVYQVGLIGWNYFFDDTKIQALINEGEKAALHALPKLQLHIKEKQKRGWRKFLPFIKELMF